MWWVVFSWLVPVQRPVIRSEACTACPKLHGLRKRVRSKPVGTLIKSNYSRQLALVARKSRLDRKIQLDRKCRTTSKCVLRRASFDKCNDPPPYSRFPFRIHSCRSGCLNTSEITIKQESRWDVTAIRSPALNYSKRFSYRLEARGGRKLMRGCSLPLLLFLCHKGIYSFCTPSLAIEFPPGLSF